MISFLFGLIIGSFANVCIFRWPRDESIRWPSSHCPHCQSKIAPRDNIPVISFFLLGRRCRSCGHPISWRYPITELAMGALFLAMQFRFAGQVRAMAFADLLCFYLLTLSIIDFDHHIIPDELSLSLCGLGWVSAWANPFLGTGMSALGQSLLASLAGGGGMLALAWLGEKTFKKEALGGGDIKLMAGFGAYLGWAGVFGSLFFGSLLGGVIALGLMLTGKKKRGETLPFGPFLSIGALLACTLPSGWLSLIFP